MRGEKEDHYGCFILEGLKTSQMRQKYISLYQVAAIFLFSIPLYIHSLDYLMIFYVRLTQMCLFSLMSCLR